MTFRCLLTIAAVLSPILACKARDVSKVKVDGGLIDFEQEYVVPLLNAHGTRFCSATFVTNNIAISAAHCFSHETGLGGDALIVTEKHVRVPEKIVIPSGWGTAQPPLDNFKRWAHDVAVLYFADEATTPHIAVETKNKLQPGSDSLRIVGFGCNTTITGYMNHDSALYTAYNAGMISWISPDTMAVESMELSETSANSYIIEGNLTVEGENRPYPVKVCPGDSGGAIIKDGNLIGVTSRVRGMKSAFASLQHSDTAQFVESALNKTLQEANHSVIKPGLTKDKLQTPKMQSVIETVRSRLRYLKDHKDEIGRELAALYPKIWKIKAEYQAKAEAQREKDRLQNQKAAVLLAKINNLQNRYVAEQIQVFPLVLDHAPAKYPAYQIIAALSRLLYPPSPRFGELPAPTVNWLDYAYAYPEGFGPVEAIEGTPPPERIRLIEAPLFEGAAASTPVVILEDIHFANDAAIASAMASYAENFNGRDKSYIVPVGTLAVGDTETIEVSTVKLLVIRNGRIIEAIP